MQPSVGWIVLLFLIVFPAFWVAICMLLGELSGWRALAREYRGRLASPAGSVGMSSGRMGLTGYRNCLNVSVGAQGLGLSVFPLLAVGSPPLVIPWPAVELVRRDRLFGVFDRLHLRLGGAVTLVLYGSAARLVESWNTRAALAETPAALARAEVERS
ncbi:MAG TPA: hypothetical protein VFJ16_21085 [Longimicrobium sp.]|nr:hypothetical protein [Longimicrobium sp.]